MPIKEVLTADEVAVILGTTPSAIRMAVSRGQEGISIPPSIKLGAKRRWLRKKVYEWLDQKAAESPSQTLSARGRPRKQAKGRLRDNVSVK
jgi:predicted DNA-binding transcriptional regulator AlpA